MTLNDSTDDDGFCVYALQPLYVLTKEAAIEDATCFRGVWKRGRRPGEDVCSMMLDDFDDDQRHKQFRMTQTTFEHLAQLVESGN